MLDGVPGALGGIGLLMRRGSGTSSGSSLLINDVASVAIFKFGGYCSGGDFGKLDSDLGVDGVVEGSDLVSRGLIFGFSFLGVPGREPELIEAGGPKPTFVEEPLVKLLLRFGFDECCLKLA